MFSCPYSSIPHTERRKLTCRVSDADFELLCRLIPSRYGLSNDILTTLFHAFIQHLRTLEHIHAYNSSVPLEPGWHSEHPTYILVESALRRVNFGPTHSDGSGTLSGPAAGQSDGPTSRGNVS